MASGSRCHATLRKSPAEGRTAYDRQVLSLNPVLYLTLGHPVNGWYRDLSGQGSGGAYEPRSQAPGSARLPNGAPAAQFNGQSQYVQVGSRRSFSITTTGCLTIEVWIRPATLQFPREEGSGYVYILGKGTPGRHEYALRMYSKRNSEVPDRPNRISAYVFNPAGGEGSGAYFQDPITLKRWIMVTATFCDLPTPAFPHGYVSIYKDGNFRESVSLDQFHVTPRPGDAPFRIATRNLDSFFQGAIGDVAIYNYALSEGQIGRTYDAMVGRGS